MNQVTGLISCFLLIAFLCGMWSFNLKGICTCCNWQAVEALALKDFLLKSNEVVLGRRVAGGMGGQIFVGKFGMQEVSWRVGSCVTLCVVRCCIVWWFEV